MKNAAYRKLIEQSKSTVDSDSNWLITLADVMTLLMVFFVMFLIAKQSESGRKSPESTAAAVKPAVNMKLLQMAIQKTRSEMLLFAVLRNSAWKGMLKFLW